MKPLGHKMFVYDDPKDMYVALREELDGYWYRDYESEEDRVACLDMVAELIDIRSLPETETSCEPDHTGVVGGRSGRV